MKNIQNWALVCIPEPLSPKINRKSAKIFRKCQRLCTFRYHTTRYSTAASCGLKTSLNQLNLLKNNFSYNADAHPVISAWLQRCKISDQRKSVEFIEKNF